MMSCWNIDSTKRPTFEALEVTFSDILEADAGYVELSSTGHQKGKNTSESGHCTPLITTGIKRVVTEAQRDERYVGLQGPKKEMYEEMETPMMDMHEDIESPVMKDKMYEDIGNPMTQKESVVRHT